MPSLLIPRCGTRGDARVAATTIFTALLLLLLLSAASAGARHILAVDLGADWAKTATFGGSSGSPVRVDVVLNDQANRKSPQCVAFRFLPYKGGDKLQSVERFFAEQAQALEPRFPKQVVCSPSLLAGYSMAHDKGQHNDVDAAVTVTKVNGNAEEEEKEEGVAVAIEGEDDEDHLLFAEDVLAFPFTVVPRLPRGSVAVQMSLSGNEDGENVVEFTSEELLGMFFGYLKHTAERSLDGEPLRHVAVTVPTGAPLVYRQAIVDAAAIAGLRTMRLVHSTTAAAAQLAYLNMDQLFPPSRETDARYVMVYDMGSRRTESVVFRLTTTQRQKKVIAVASAVVNNTLGGRTFDRCIARYVERQLFPHAKPTPIEPVLGKPTAAARNVGANLLRAANMARERLSVNQVVPFVVQGVRDGRNGDFTATISRSTFEEECAELFDEAVRLRDRAIAQTNGAVRSVQDLLRFEVIGGATRMPKLLERLSEGYGKVADRTLNGDEAVVVGTAHMSAATVGFSVLDFRVEEPLMTNVYFTVSPPLPAVTDNASTMKQQRGSQRLHLLFAKGNTLLPAVHSLLFQNRTEEFTLTLRDKSGRFSRAVVVGGVKESIGLAREVPQRMHTRGRKGRTGEVVSLESTKVVVEVTLTESGIPLVSNAYLHATYVREKRLRQQRQPKEGGSEGGREEQEAADGETNATSDEFSTDNNSAADATGMGEKAAGGDDSHNRMDEANRQDGENREKSDELQWDEEEEGVRKGNSMDRDEVDEEEEEEFRAAVGGDGAKTEAEAEAEAEAKANDTIPGDSVNVTRFVRSWKLRFAASSAPVATGVSMEKSEAVASRDRLRTLQRVDNERLLRSALRNDIEALILHYKTVEAWTDPNNKAAEWRDVVMDVARWFDEADDDVEASVLQQQHQRLKELQRQLS